MNFLRRIGKDFVSAWGEADITDPESRPYCLMGRWGRVGTKTVMAMYFAYEALTSPGLRESLQETWQYTQDHPALLLVVAVLLARSALYDGGRSLTRTLGERKEMDARR